MGLQNLVSLAEIVNALAVSLTLLVLVVSIRQNTRAQNVSSVETLAAAIAAINIPAMESPALGSALARALKDWSSASRDERILAHFFLFSYFKLIETAWYQQRAGTLEEEQWLGWDKVVRSFYHTDGIQLGWWPNRRHAYSPAFQKYLAESEPPIGVGSLGDIFDYALKAATD